MKCWYSAFPCLNNYDCTQNAHKCERKEYDVREPSMTRRHFELIANVIDALDLDGFGHNVAPAEIRLNIAQDFSRVFEGVNKSFDRAMFINAATKSDRKRAAKVVEREVGKHAALGMGYGKLTNRAAAVDANRPAVKSGYLK